MALQVWLPLNGNLNNLGLILLPNPSINSMSFSDSGKISSLCGKNIVGWHLTSEILGNQWSVATWINSPNTFNVYNNIIFCKNISNSTDCQIYLSIINNNTLNLGVNGPSTSILYSYTFDLNTWYHIAATYNGNTASLYLNGQLVKTGIVTTAFPSERLNIQIDGRSANTNNTNSTGSLGMRYNDFRLYDHALSPKEVHEIAKGLVLHYKLDRQGLGLDNILINTDFSTRSTVSAWNTEKNGTLVASSWGGYNSGVSNASTCYHAHLKEVNGEYVYEYKKTTSENWLGIAQSGLQNKLVAGEKYTFSWEQYSVEGNNYVGTGLYYCKTNSTSYNFLGLAYGSPKVIGKWQKFEYTFTAPTDCDYTKNISWYIYGHYPSGSDGTFYMRKPKLEKGSIATTWMPAVTDSLYINNGFNTISIPDCSGYNNNPISETNIDYSTDTFRYMCSAIFNGTSYITMNSIGSVLTMSAWFKTTKNKSTSLMICCDKASLICISIYSGTIIGYFGPSGSLDVGSKCTLGSSYKENDWNHVVVIKTGVGTRDIYCNGVKLTPTSNDYWSATTDGAYIGTRNYSSSPLYFYGYLSDVRFYTTILSELDILELYNTSALIDNKGDLFGYLFNELRYNIAYDANYGIISKQYIGGLSSYTLANCLCTLTDTGYRIYRPPNVNPTDNGSTMWGGFILRNTNNMYDFKDGHTYILEFDIKGQSSNYAEMGWYNSAGWPGGGLLPAPSNVVHNNPVGTNFNSTEWKHYFYKWTINDGVYKVCTNTYSSFVEGTTYVSYRDFKFGFSYKDTGLLGTDLYIKNLSLYDITDNTNIDISKTGIINTGNFVEEYNESKFLFDNAINSTQLIEI